MHSGVLLLGLVLGPSIASHGKESSEFDGTWRQKSKIPKELVIKLDGGTLMLTMKGPGKIHSVNMTFQIGGPEVTYTGLDGDEFHIKATRDGESLVFDGIEHEEGSELLVHEVWTLRNEGGSKVLVDTKSAKNPGKAARVAEYERVQQVR
jgi:hypothetical protein